MNLLQMLTNLQMQTRDADEAEAAEKPLEQA